LLSLFLLESAPNRFFGVYIDEVQDLLPVELLLLKLATWE
jgi:hypothetical protein